MIFFEVELLMTGAAATLPARPFFPVRVPRLSRRRAPRLGVGRPSSRRAGLARSFAALAAGAAAAAAPLARAAAGPQRVSRAPGRARELLLYGSGARVQGVWWCRPHAPGPPRAVPAGICSGLETIERAYFVIYY